MGMGMREPYVEGVAIHSGPESCVGVREGAGEALTGVRARVTAKSVGAALLEGGSGSRMSRAFALTRGCPHRLGDCCEHGVPPAAWNQSVCPNAMWPGIGRLVARRVEGPQVSTMSTSLQRSHTQSRFMLVTARGA
jgi:hypothetical protein